MKLKYTRLQLAMEVITAILLLLTWGYLIVSWSGIPDAIPGHYNAEGIVDRWGNKNEILAMPIVSTVLYALLTAVSFLPSIWNVPVSVTEENREFVYSSLRTMLILMKAEILATFAYILYCDIKIHSLSIWFLPLVLIVVFGTLAYFILRIRRAGESRKSDSKREDS